MGPRPEPRETPQASPPGSGRDRVLLMVGGRENRRLLADWLSVRYEVLIPDDGHLPTAPFDLCVIDGPTLEPLRDALLQRRRAETPCFLPVLLVSLRDGMRFVTRFLYEVVDELIFMPIEKIELAVRLENLLRARRDSLALMRQSQELFAALVEQSLVGVYLAEDDHITYINRAGAAMFGYTPEAIIAHRGPLDLADESDRAAVAAALAPLRDGRAGSVHYAYRGKHHYGKPLYAEAFERQVNFQGRPVRLGTLLNVTERHLLEHARANAQADEIAHLRQIDLMKDQFLSILSHELRTPINAIMGFSSILDDEVAGPLTGQQHNYLQKVLAGAEVMLALINDLLDVSRIQAGKFTLTFEPVDLHAVACQAVSSLAALSDKKQLEVRCTVPTNLPRVQADPQRLAQVLVNLVGNAIKFTPGGGRIEVSGCRTGECVRVEVRDTGIGIDDGDREKLFKPFSQVDMSATRRAGGTGLGLSIVKAIVEAHGGRVGMESAPGRGSTFWFELPITQAGR